jgi:hypothetical protein
MFGCERDYVTGENCGMKSWSKKKKYRRMRGTGQEEGM